MAAIDSLNYQKDVLVYGVDGSPDGKKLINEGLLTGTAQQSPKVMEKLQWKPFINYLIIKMFKKRFELSVELINKSNIENYDVSRWQ